MGTVCENCGWRKYPSNNTGKGCIFTNTKKLWKESEYNRPCSNYVMDTTLRDHLKEVLGINNQTNEYDPQFGDNKICECGHAYERHFDNYKDMAAVGCKYCGCQNFKERK